MNVTAQAAPLPTNWKGTPQQLIEAFLDRLEITVDGNSFVIGDVMPEGNQGPWLKNGSQWWVWSEDESTYVPLDISASTTEQIYIGDIANGPPNPVDFSLWYQLNGTTVNGLYYYAGSVAGWVTTPSPLVNNCITTAMLQNQCVTAEKIAPGALSGAIPNGSLSLAAFGTGPANYFVRMNNTGTSAAWTPLMTSSPNLAYANVITWNHGLPATPNIIRAVWVCIAPGEPNGYSLGDEISAGYGEGNIASGNGINPDGAFTIMANATIINLIQMSKNATNSGGTTYFIPADSPGYWQVKIYAGVG